MTHKQMVLKYIETHPGKNVYLNDIADEIGLTALQVSSVVSAALKTNCLPGLERVANGIVRYSPNKARSGRLYEEIGRSKTGIIVLQDEDGNLFKVEQL